MLKLPVIARKSKAGNDKSYRSNKTCMDTLYPRESFYLCLYLVSPLANVL